MTFQSPELFRSCFAHAADRQSRVDTSCVQTFPILRKIAVGRVSLTVRRDRPGKAASDAYGTNFDLANTIHNHADYFARNAARMNYPSFRKQHLFVGSGVIEAGCNTVIGHRLKQSGVFWTVKGANALLALRCAHLNGRFEDHWESRRAA